MLTGFNLYKLGLDVAQYRHGAALPGTYSQGTAVKFDPTTGKITQATGTDAPDGILQYTGTISSTPLPGTIALLGGDLVAFVHVFEADEIAVVLQNADAAIAPGATRGLTPDGLSLTAAAGNFKILRLLNGNAVGANAGDIVIGRFTSN